MRKCGDLLKNCPPRTDTQERANLMGFIVVQVIQRTDTNVVKLHVQIQGGYGCAHSFEVRRVRFVAVKEFFSPMPARINIDANTAAKSFVEVEVTRYRR